VAKTHIRLTDRHQTELAKILRELAYRHGLWQVFRDFVAMSSIAMSNAVDKSQFETREAEYMKVVARYTKDEANLIAKGLGYVVMGLETGMQDFLGSLFMSLELGDSWKGQFFTPYEISYLMASITVGDRASAEIERKGFISVCDPCVGGGAMVIAAAHALQDAKINYQQHMHVVAVDIDLTAVHMAYVQLSLRHIPAVVYHGNSLSGETWSAWYTPAHVLGFWRSKLRRAGDDWSLPVLEPSTASATPGLPKRAAAGGLPLATAGPSLPLVRPQRLAVPTNAVNLRSQIELF